MKKLIKEIWPYFLILFILATMLWVIFFLVGCISRQSNLHECVVDSVWLVPQASVAEPFPIYHFHTDCGVTTTAPTKQYKKGDTIKFINN
jgi:hypothetical protein